MDKKNYSEVMSTAENRPTTSVISTTYITPIIVIFLLTMVSSTANIMLYKPKFQRICYRNATGFCYDFGRCVIKVNSVVWVILDDGVITVVQVILVVDMLLVVEVMKAAEVILVVGVKPW